MTRDDLNGTISYAVQLELNDEGREKFTLATSYCYLYVDSFDEDRFRNIIAIVYDNEVISAPRVADVIDGGQAMISSLKSAEEASLLASTIRSGVLSLELKPVNCYVEGEEFNIDEWQEKKSVQDGDDVINGDDNLNRYSFICTDEDDIPVPGVNVQICTDETCMMQESGEDGRIDFDGEPQKYNIHIYSFPKEYELVSEREFDTAETYETYYIRFKRKEGID